MLCVQWHDKSTSWEKLSDLKESYPVNVAENVVMVGITNQPTFSWGGSPCAPEAGPDNCCSLKLNDQKDKQIWYQGAMDNEGSIAI